MKICFDNIVRSRPPYNKANNPLYADIDIADDWVERAISDNEELLTSICMLEQPEHMDTTDSVPNVPEGSNSTVPTNVPEQCVSSNIIVPTNIPTMQQH